MENAPSGFFPNALSVLHKEFYIRINSLTVIFPIIAISAVRREKRPIQRSAIKYSHVVGLLACFFEPSQFTCIPLAIGAVTLCGDCPFSVCGYRERLMSTYLWCEWEDNETPGGSHSPWPARALICLGKGDRGPKQSWRSLQWRGFRGQPQHPTNRRVF